MCEPKSPIAARLCTLWQRSKSKYLVKLLYFAALFGVGYLLYQIYGKKLLKNGPSNLIKPAIIAIGILLVLAVITGRANAIFAVIGGLMASAFRLAPLAMRFYPQIRGALKSFGIDLPGSVSKVNTKTLVLTIDQVSGEIDGDVLNGNYADRKLSELTLDEIKSYYQFCSTEDPRALKLIAAFIQKEMPEQWTTGPWYGQASSNVNADQGMTTQEALDILGLEAGADREKITHAHKRLMTKLHPDKGGNDYLATRINQAKDFLLAKL